MNNKILKKIEIESMSNVIQLSNEHDKTIS